MKFHHTALLFAVSFALGVTFFGMIHTYSSYSKMLAAREITASTRFQASGIIEDVSIKDGIATVQVRMAFPNIPNVPLVEFSATPETIIDVRQPILEGQKVTGYREDILGSTESLQKNRVITALLDIGKDNSIRALQILLDDPVFQYNRR